MDRVAMICLALSGCSVADRSVDLLVSVDELTDASIPRCSLPILVDSKTDAPAHRDSGFHALSATVFEGTRWVATGPHGLWSSKSERWAVVLPRDVQRVAASSSAVWAGDAAGNVYCSTDGHRWSHARFRGSVDDIATWRDVAYIAGGYGGLFRVTATCHVSASDVLSPVDGPTRITHVSVNDSHIAVTRHKQNLQVCSTRDHSCSTTTMSDRAERIQLTDDGLVVHFDGHDQVWPLPLSTPSTTQARAARRVVDLVSMDEGIALADSTGVLLQPSGRRYAGDVRRLAVFDRQLYIAGERGVVRWDGTTAEPVHRAPARDLMVSDGGLWVLTTSGDVERLLPNHLAIGDTNQRVTNLIPVSDGVALLRNGQGSIAVADSEGVRWARFLPGPVGDSRVRRLRGQTLIPMPRTGLTRFDGATDLGPTSASDPRSAKDEVYRDALGAVDVAWWRGELWVATRTGLLGKVTPGESSHEASVELCRAPGAVQRLVVSNGALWAAGPSGLWRWEGEIARGN